jgi:alkylation response protein AidB-like acyl-CoA dehydrogenase
MSTDIAAPQYGLTEEQLEFRDAIRQIVAERVAPRAAEIDAKAEYPWDIRRLFAEQDLLGLPFEPEHGGTGTGTLMLNLAVEEVARACASSALILMVQELGTLPIRLFGTEEQKRRFLPRCASGEWSPAFALSEPDAGSDPGGMLTHAVLDGDEWIVTGTKNWITNLGVADFYVVFAKTDPQAGHSRGISAFIVEADRPGFSVGKLEHKLGIKGSPTGQPIFDDVRIPAANLIGEAGRGMHVALAALAAAARGERSGRCGLGCRLPSASGDPDQVAGTVIDLPLHCRPAIFSLALAFRSAGSGAYWSCLATPCPAPSPYWSHALTARAFAWSRPALHMSW